MSDPVFVLSQAPAPDYGEIAEDQDIQKIDNFDNMNLKQELLRGIYSYGFEKPSTIPLKAIVPTIKCVLVTFVPALFSSPASISPLPCPSFLSLALMFYIVYVYLILASLVSSPIDRSRSRDFPR